MTILRCPEIIIELVVGEEESVYSTATAMGAVCPDHEQATEYLSQRSTSVLC
jgi:hypothetical protein